MEPDLSIPLKRRIDGDRLPSEVIKRLRMCIENYKKSSNQSDQKVMRRKTSRPNNEEANAENSNTAESDAAVDKPNAADEPMDLAEPNQPNTSQYNVQNNKPKIENTAGGTSNDGSHDQNVRACLNLDRNAQLYQHFLADQNVQPDQNNRRDGIERSNIHRLGRYLRRLYLPALLRGERQPLVQFFFQPHFVYYLVSDMAVLGFGRAKHDLIHQLHMAHNMDGFDLSVRPYQSNLRVLSITGYRDITNRSLEHLAVSAPYLTRLDFSHTRVTKAGVEAFKALKPECEVIYCDVTNE